MALCIKCDHPVTVRQHAIDCEMCGKWQHRLCDTGITFAEYREAKKW